MKKLNQLKMIFDSRSINESFSRMAVATFCSQLDMTVDELGDIKTVVSEAVTNCVVHAYRGEKYRHEENKVHIHCILFDCGIEVTIQDYGQGIENVELARQAMYTTSPETERSGLGFTIMESFTDKMDVVSKPEEGTTITMLKLFKNLQ